MIEAIAFLATCVQLQAFSRGAMRDGWIICLVCCALWLVVAVDKHMIFLAGQQFIFAGLAIQALVRKKPA